MDKTFIEALLALRDQASAADRHLLVHILEMARMEALLGAEVKSCLKPWP